ncbi:MAG: hypothetical protein AB8B74_03920 [Crocinitomicaceae bacterium]
MKLSKKIREITLITISDLKDNYFDRIPISSDQILALKWFDKYRVEILKKANKRNVFHQRYAELKVIENTVDYREFLKNFEI